MIEVIKKKIWDMIKKKKVSLAMIYDIDGNIIWYKGRELAGEDVINGEGFCKSYIKESLRKKDRMFMENGIVTSAKDDLSRSAESLLIKNVVILPLDNDFFLYIDSGIKEPFGKIELELFKMLGELLKESIWDVKVKEDGIGGITGNSEYMRKIRERILKYSLVDSTILLKGATGTGKNHLAESIHNYSGRSGKFKVINVPGIPESLFESEMFGYKKGAFTNAVKDKKGLIEEAEGGTLLIDEITEIPVSIQAKLLRFVEQKKYSALGETTEREVDVRIIASTNKDIQEEIKSKRFREDLYFRLNTLEIELPLLKDRKEDIKALVLEKEKYLRGNEIGEGFWEVLENYDWPGNIRELFSFIEKIGVECESPITGEKIMSHIRDSKNQISILKEKGIINEIWKKLKEGESFWKVVKEPYLERELNRREVKEIVGKGLAEAENKYVNLVKIFNLKENEYKKMMNFLKKNNLQ